MDGCQLTILTRRLNGSSIASGSEPPVPLLNGAPDEIANFLIAGRNPTPEARAARQARTIAAGKIYGTPESAQIRKLSFQSSEKSAKTIKISQM